MKVTRTHFNQRTLAFLVLITGVVGGLLFVFLILLLCKYCLNRKNLREAEQMKLLYEALNEASRKDFTCLQHSGIRYFSPLEPRRSNPLDRYQPPEYQWQVPTSKQIKNDYHSTGSQHSPNTSHRENREQTSNKQINVNVEMEEEQAYLQVDPRCYVRQNSNASLMVHRKSDTPRLEKVHSINVDTRPSHSTASLSPYRQSSFDVALACRSSKPNQMLTPTPSPTPQPETYYTPRGSNISIMTNPIMNSSSTGSQHLAAPTTPISRKNSASNNIEKREITATIDPSATGITVRSLIVQREHEYSRSLEHSTVPVVEQSLQTTTNTTNEKQSRSYDAVHLLRPGSLRPEGAVSRRTKSYECADEHHQARISIAPPPIIIKIPDMSEIVQAAQLSCLRERKEGTDLEDYQRSESRKATLIQQGNDGSQSNHMISPEDLWRLRQSYELEEQKRRKQDSIQERSSPDEFSIDLLTSTSIDSAGAMPIDLKANQNDEDSLKYEHRRKSSSNLLLPPPEVRRQALRRTFEKRRSCINQSNARREQELLLSNQNNRDDGLNPNNDVKSDFSNLLKNLNSRSENSSFERSLETDFDMQSDTSSRGPNDQFTSIESSGNENTLPDQNNRFNPNCRPAIALHSPQLSPHHDDSGYKSLESQNSQNRTFSMDWMSADGAESVIFVGDGRKHQQRSIDVRELDDQLTEEKPPQPIQNNNSNRNVKLLQVGSHRSYQEEILHDSTLNQSSKLNTFQQRSLSTNIPLVADDIPTPINLVTQTNSNSSNSMKNQKLQSTNALTSSINRTASKKRREFSKEKKNISSNIENCLLPTDDNLTKMKQTNENQTKINHSNSTLQVRHPDLRRTKSDETRNPPFTTNLNSLDEEESNENSNETKTNNRLSSSTDGILVSDVLPSTNSINRQHLSPNSARIRVHQQTLQRSPSSTTSKETKPPSSQIFRSQRGSISLDTETSPVNLSSSPTSNKMKSTYTSSLIPSCVSKPRLKFSMVRDSTTSSGNHNAPVYSMPITRDYSIDEKTNRIVNEFLMFDPSYEEHKRNNTDETTLRVASKRHYHSHHPRIRAKGLEEQTLNSQNVVNSHQTTIQKQISQQSTRPAGNKQRHQNTFQINTRKHDRSQHTSIHLDDSIEQVEEDDSSDPTSSRAVLNSQSNGIHVRRAHSMAAPSPSIIITGDDSGS